MSDLTKQVRERLSKATKGPISLETVRTSIGVCHKIGPLGISSKMQNACLYDDCYSDKPRDLVLLADAELFAHAPADLSALVSQVEAAERVVEALRESIEWVDENALPSDLRKWKSALVLWEEATR